MLGSKGAMACTVAVESVIVEHYNEQIRQLLRKENVDRTLLEVSKPLTHSISIR